MTVDGISTAGAVYIFVSLRPWIQQAKLTAPSPGGVG